jgi:hypothetical protein
MGTWPAVALGLAALGTIIDPLLGLWLFLTLAPFFLVFTEIVHLAYPIVPASIIIAAGAERLWQRAAYPIVRRAVAVCLGVLLLDQALNLYGTWHVMGAVRSGLVTVGERLRDSLPRGAAVVTNAVNGYDLALFSNGWIDVRFSVAAGVPRQRVVDTTSALAELIEKKPGEVYFVDCDQPFLPAQGTYHSHKFIRNRNVYTADMGTIGITDALYPFLDPLALLIDRPYVPFLGPPDEVNDYYHGPARDHRPFLREVFAAFHLYHVTGSDVRN